MENEVVRILRNLLTTGNSSKDRRMELRRGEAVPCLSPTDFMGLGLCGPVVPCYHLRALPWGGLTPGAVECEQEKSWAVKKRGRNHHLKDKDSETSAAIRGNPDRHFLIFLPDFACCQL